MTADEPRVRVTTNLAFGICLILLGTTLILDRLQLVPAAQLLRFWPIALVLVGGALVIQSFQRPSTTTPAPNEDLRLGQIIAFVFFIIFVWNGFSAGTSTLTDSRDRVEIVAILGRHTRVVETEAFRGGELTAIMGRSDLDLRRATVAPGQNVEIEVFTLMGGSTIRVPDGWSIDVRATPIMGDVRDRRAGERDIQGSPRLVIRGFIMMGGMTIRS